MFRGGILKSRRRLQCYVGARWSIQRTSTGRNNRYISKHAQTKPVKRAVASRGTTLLKVTAGCFAGTVGTLGLLLSSDNLGTKLKKWAPLAGFVVENFGETVLAMEFDENIKSEPLTDHLKPPDAPPKSTSEPEQIVPNNVNNLPLASDYQTHTTSGHLSPPQPVEEELQLKNQKESDVEKRLKMLRKESQLVRDSAASIAVKIKPPDPKSILSSESASSDPVLRVATPSPEKIPQIEATTLSPESLNEAMARLRELQDKHKLVVLDAKKHDPVKVEEDLISLNQQLVSTKALIKELESELEKSEEQSVVLRMNLDERESYLRDNIQLLQEGRDIYNETVAAYAELAEELKLENEELLAGMNNSSHQRIRELDVLDTEIKSMENILAWYGQNRTRNQKAVLMSLGVMQLEEHFRNGSSFSRELKFIERASGDDTVISAVCGAVPEELRRTGVVTKSQLLAKWDLLERSARQAAFTPQPATSLWDPILARIFSWFLLPQRTDELGEDEQARISRVGFYLEHDDLRRAVDEVAVLEGLARKVVTDWLALARDRLLASEVIGIIRVDLVRRHMEP